MKPETLDPLVESFRRHFGTAPAVAAYAPGRVEILGNHTDYNEGFVLSAAINFGTCFVAAPSPDRRCRLVAADIGKEAAFDLDSDTPETQERWSNYVKGVAAGLREHGALSQGFLGMFLGNLPLGAGLSSSAALEMSSGLALSALAGRDLPPLVLAKIGQQAEHRFAGVKCGLLDQISSLFGQADRLVMSDFRSLEVQTVPLGHDACFLMCNTNAKHSLVDSEYNERRARCEEAAAFFATKLDHPVKALRDVTWQEWEQRSGAMNPAAAKRAAHVIGENTRVLQGRGFLEHGKLDAFGRLMFDSHESSRKHFENSCLELDFLVDTARRVPGVLGARLSGGGFGGSAVVLLHPRDAETAGQALASAYRKEFGHPCDVRTIVPSAGARVIRVG